ncbi:MAG: NADH-quinone oxidoreductase subunit J [Magnetospirillum sp. WYHS-4]
MIQALVFYMFAAVTVFSGVMVISARNPVHSVLFLVLAFFSAAGLFVLLGAEFLAMILVVVYVGAVAVLFLFVVMMLDINFVELRQGFQEYLPLGALIAFILFLEVAVAMAGMKLAPDATAAAAAPIPEGVTNTQALGQVLYTQYLYLFQVSGLVLLVAMIGAIVLTHRHRPGVRRQDIGAQVARNRANSLEIRKVEPGRGI